MSRRGGEGRREAILPVTCQVDVLQRRGCVHRIGQRRDAEVTKRVARERQHLQLSQAMACEQVRQASRALQPKRVLVSFELNHPSHHCGRVVPIRRALGQQQEACAVGGRQGDVAQ